MRKALAALAILVASVSAALAQNTFNQSTQASAFFNATQAITRVITGVSGKRIYLTQLTVSALTTSAVTISRGTGTNCGTDTVVVFAKTFATGDLNFVTGSGSSAIAVIPTGVDVCITVGTAVSTGWLSWAQF
jgi:hypothetical protein